MVDIFGSAFPRKIPPTPLFEREAVKKSKIGMEKPPLLSRGGKNSRRQNRREIHNYEAFPRVPPSDAGNLKIT
jgi:hypothetical protein